MNIKTYLKQFGLQNLIIIAGLILFATGLIAILFEPLQYVFKKLFLVCLWYSFCYIVRKLRIGGIDWSDEKDKKIYYYVLLLGASLIIAFA
jgi:4-hydroxybenzoate polyprenyltransferase